MKRFVKTLPLLLLVAALCACGGPEEPTPSTSEEVPSSSSYTLPELPQGVDVEEQDESPPAVSIEGNVVHLESLWDLNADSYVRGAALDSLLTDIRFPVIGPVLYRFRADDTTLLADTLHLDTLVQGEQTIHDFGTEKIINHFYNDLGLTVYTDAAAYRLDDTFTVTHRRQWPSYLEEQDIRYAVLDESFQLLAYYASDASYTEGGTWLVNLELGTAPVLIQKLVPLDLTTLESEGPFPIRFISGNRLFLGISMWERIGEFRVLDLEGNRLETFPYAASGVLGGGNCIVNEVGAIFHPMQESMGDHYYSFSSQELRSADWWDMGRWEQDQYWTWFVPNPKDPNVWVTSCLHREGTYQPKRITFQSFDFANEVIITHPVTVHNASAMLMGVGEKGQMLVAYSNMDFENRQSGFFLYLGD